MLQLDSRGSKKQKSSLLLWVAHMHDYANLFNTGQLLMLVPDTELIYDQTEFSFQPAGQWGCFLTVFMEENGTFWGKCCKGERHGRINKVKSLCLFSKKELWDWLDKMWLLNKSGAQRVILSVFLSYYRCAKSVCFIVIYSSAQTNSCCKFNLFLLLFQTLSHLVTQ